MKRGKNYEKRKLSVYLGEDRMEELRAEAERQHRTISSLIQMAWDMSRHKLGMLPGPADFIRRSSEEQ